MKRRITGFDTDEHGDWRAELECGHFQHVRHEPPLVSREWVLEKVGRDSRLGFELECKRCDEEGEKETSVAS
ncbi:MAG TPA: DUF3565 domain-containing protein [Pyrinomonadaceae bacterium]